MLIVDHSGIQLSLNLDTSSFTGDVETDVELAYIQGLKAGRLVTVDASGYAQLADGAAGEPVGWLLNDAAGAFFENKPAIASEKVASTFGNAVLTTDQIDTALTFAPGDLLWAGTGAKVGLVTNVDPGGSRAVGIAGSAASLAAADSVGCGRSGSRPGSRRRTRMSLSLRWSRKTICC